MKEHPIIFSGEMVVSILDGRKTQTRRAVRRQEDPIRLKNCPYGKVGDRLWVRETFVGEGNINAPVTQKGEWCGLPKYGGKWKPSIHMPRWSARILLEITNTRVERVQDITLEDIEDEGIKILDTGCSGEKGILAYQDFQNLWDSLNANRDYAWDENPWVWVIEFKVVKKYA